ncbi:MAG TPA: ankyrin repeat domain-containing protein [Gammaproteobacteria bacterium]|nr:ankyrin repeat domain-containing protein [Gammaproteobacteria bacterium]
MNRWVLLVAGLLAAVAVSAAGSSLSDLIQQGKRTEALAAIAAGADVNAPQGDGTTPLHWAVYKVDTDLVATLLKRGAKADVVNKYGSSPLAEAVKIGNDALVKTLLDAGASAESPNQDGETALMLAARVGATDVAKLLVERGANVNATESWKGQTALMWAADSNSPDLAQLLIAHGADVNTRAVANDWAAQITTEPRAQYRPTGGFTPLIYAARSGCTRCVRAMLEAGADIDRPNPDGTTPLMFAIDSLRFDTARLLLDQGANPQHQDWYGRTALYVAVDMSSYNRRSPQSEDTGETSAHDVIRMLLEKGVNPNSQLNFHRPGRGGNSGRFADDLLTTGCTPLIRAAIGEDVDAVKMLLEHGALVDLPNVMGVTPLMAAAGVGVGGLGRRPGGEGGDAQARVTATLEVLVAAGADVNAKITDINGRSARIARQSQMTDRGGQTALYGAVKNGWTRVVQYLLAHGANVDIKDDLGKSPVDAALGQIGGRDNVVSQEIAELLKSAGKRGG